MSDIKFTKNALIKAMEDFKKKLPMPFDKPFEYMNIVDVKLEDNCLVGILDSGDEYNIIHSSQVVDE